MVRNIQYNADELQHFYLSYTSGEAASGYYKQENIITMSASSEFETVFGRLKAILQNHAGNFTVKPDTNDAYGLQGKPGPAALQAWGGKLRKPVMPVAWIEIGKAYVSYHVMG